MINNTSGIYAYLNKNNEIIYIGKDSYLDKDKRHNLHLSTKRPTVFEVNLQKDPGSFIYQKLLFCNPTDMDDIEFALIKTYQPKYNYEYVERIKKSLNQTIIWVSNLIKKYSIEPHEKEHLLKLLTTHLSL